MTLPVKGNFSHDDRIHCTSCGKGSESAVLGEFVYLKRYENSFHMSSLCPAPAADPGFPDDEYTDNFEMHRSLRGVSHLGQVKTLLIAIKF